MTGSIAVLSALGWILFSYLLGSIPFGVIIAKTFCKTNPQEAGSGNIGATNVSRLCGLPAGVVTLLCDAGKGILAVSIGLYFISAGPFFITLTGLAVVLGHRFSIFLHFKGGKAVATSIGVFGVLAPAQTAIAVIICIFVIWWKKYVSLGSLAFMFFLPIAILISGRLNILVLSLAVSALVIHAHKGNIRRLISGEEKPWAKSKDS